MYSSRFPIWDDIVHLLLPKGSAAARSRQPSLSVAVLDKGMADANDAIGRQTTTLTAAEGFVELTLDGCAHFPNFPLDFSYSIVEGSTAPETLTISSISAINFPGKGKRGLYLRFELLEVSGDTARRSLSTAHCPLSTVHCPLPTAHCPLPIAHLHRLGTSSNSLTQTPQKMIALCGTSRCASTYPRPHSRPCT